jgi:hypothetical protein
MPIPEHVTASRARIAAMFIPGCHGIEIGALDAPTPLPAGTHARYVDFRTTTELARQYPELDATTFVPVDVVDDGERLATFGAHSADFIIANQMLEHCENPLGTLRRHLEVVAHSGWLLYAMPDRRITFDRRRPITPFEHLVADDRDGGEASRFGHYVEWATLVNDVAEPEAAREHARKNIANRYSIHFHVWDAAAWLDFLARARTYLHDVFEVRYFEFTGTEILCVLRRD